MKPDVSIIEKRATEMVESQRMLNDLILNRPQWTQMPYYRAVWVEAGELMDHLGWKWWKKQKTNREQAVLEVIDIIHFLVSCWMVDNPDVIKHPTNTLVRFFSKLDTMAKTPKLEDAREACEYLVRFALTKTETEQCTDPLAVISKFLGLSHFDIYKTYIAKNTLNIFRQRNGYNNGTYVKTWNGREDNEVLTEIISSLENIEDLTAEYIYNSLTNEYSKILETIHN